MTSNLLVKTENGLGPVPVTLETRMVGSTVLVHAPGRAGADLVSWVTAVPADPERTVVVLAVPGLGDPVTWATIAQLLRGRGALRLIAAAGRAIPAASAQWLAEQLGVDVVAAGSAVRAVAGRYLFAEGGSWLRFRTGRRPKDLGSRFPHTDWDAAIGNLPIRIGRWAVAEPVMAGLWLHRGDPYETKNGTRPAPVLDSPALPDRPTIIVGAVGEDVSVEDVCTLLRALPPRIRRRVRLVALGVTPADRSFGQAVADSLDEPVLACLGLPVATPDGGIELLTIEAPDRRWQPFAGHVQYHPVSRARADAPRIIDYRPPVPDLPVLDHNLFEIPGGAALEITQCGLWIRTRTEPVAAQEIRDIPLDPSWCRIVVGAPGDTVPSDTLANAAVWLFSHLDPASRQQARVCFADSLPHQPAVRAQRLP